jgi:hypothetical protein
MNGEKNFKSLKKRCQNLVTVTVIGRKRKIYCNSWKSEVLGNLPGVFLFFNFNDRLLYKFWTKFQK